MANSLGSLVADLRLETAAFSANLKNATESLKSGVGAMENSMKGLQAAAGLVQGAIAGWAGSQIVGAITNTVTMFGEAQNAALELNAMLEATGRYSAEASDKINDTASALSRMTTIDDDDIVAATATLGNFAKQLKPDDLARAQKAIVGLSAVMKQDLDASAKQLGKTISGASDTIGRTGITISSTTDQTERLNQVLQKTGGFFSTAEAQAAGVDGRLKQMNISWANLQEAIGGVIADGLDLNNTLGDTTGSINSVTDAINANHDALARWVGFFRNLLGLVQNGVSVVVTSIGALVEGVIWGLARSTDVGLMHVNAFMRSLTAGINNFTSGVLNPFLAKLSQATNGAIGNFQLPQFGAPQIPLGGLGSIESKAYQDIQVLIKSTSLFAKGFSAAASNIAKGNPYSRTNRSKSASDGNGSDSSGGGGGGKGKGSGSNQKSEAEKQMDKLKQQADQLKESIKTPWDKYKEGVAEADKLLKLHLITLDEFKAKQEQLEKSVALKFVGAPKLNVPQESPVFDKVAQQIQERHQKLMDDGKQLTIDTQTASEKLAATKEHLNQLYSVGAINITTYNRALQQAIKDSQDGTSASQQFAEAVGNIIGEFGDKFFDTFISSLKGGKAAFSDFVSSALEDLAKLIFKLTVTIPIANALSKALGGSSTTGNNNNGNGSSGGGFLGFLGNIGTSIAGNLLGKIHLPGRAAGGPVSAGSSYIVGEKRPEIFTPDRNGTILPSTQMGGGGNITIAPVMQVTTGVAGTVRAELAQMMPGISKQIQKDVIAAIAKGGKMASVVGRTK